MPAPSHEQCAVSIALVTGAAGGIGRSIVARLLADGRHVLATDRGEAGLAALGAAHPGAALTTVVSDLSETTSYSALVTHAVGLGNLDLLVNNAVVSRYEPFLEVTHESWREVVDVGLSAAFFLSQHAARHMLAAGGAGSIVNLASVNSFAAERDASHYAIVKGGIAQLTRALAVELSPSGIRVNAVAPGPIRTPKLAPIQDSPEFAPALQRLPLRRIGRPDEIAEVIAFLASDAASYLSGSIVLADGGLMAAL